MAQHNRQFLNKNEKAIVELVLKAKIKLALHDSSIFLLAQFIER